MIPQQNRHIETDLERDHIIAEKQEKSSPVPQFIWSAVCLYTNTTSIQEAAKRARASDLVMFAACINFDNFLRKEFVCADIIFRNLATEGQAVLVRNCRLMSPYKGQTNKKCYSDSTICIGHRRHNLFSLGTLLCLPSSISRLWALRRKAASSKEFIVCNALEIFFKFKLGFELRIISQFRGVTNGNIPMLHEMVTDSISDDEKMRNIIQLIIPEITEPQAIQ